MEPDHEPGMLALLLGFAVALYMVTWLLVGSPGYSTAPAVALAPVVKLVASPAHQSGRVVFVAMP